MVLIEWQPGYMIGIEDIDKQHQKLLTILNEFFQSVQEEKEYSTIKRVLKNLMEYTREHFKNEEDLMIQHDYPEYKNHSRQHRNLEKKVMDFINFAQDEKKGISIDLLIFLQIWWQEHILGADKRFGYFLTEKH